MIKKIEVFWIDDETIMLEDRKGTILNSCDYIVVPKLDPDCLYPARYVMVEGDDCHVYRL